MAQSETRSLQQIKRETEQARASLTDTVEQLRTSVAETASDIRHRIRPEVIKAEVSDYIKTRGEQLLSDATAAARRNPMQAVAVGASVAYPLLRLARAIPAPILMVGAGLFFAGSKAGQAATQKASDVAADLSGKLLQQARELGNQMQESGSAASTYAADQFDRLSATVSGKADQTKGVADASGATIASGSKSLKDSVTSANAALVDQAGSFKDDGVRLASSAAEQAQEMASDATAAVRSALNSVGDTGMDAARTIRNKAADAADRTGKTILQTIEQNPLLVAGVGLLIGGLIASALPRSDFEDDLVGDASSAAKRQAQVAAAKGFDAAKSAAGEIYDETARQAETEGLTTDGIGKAAQDITQRVRRVAEAAVTTAFEPTEQHQQPSAHGDQNHG
jgi:ElaB/YqjD/DUF883 family membrane-anchored ribosome-binding protein